MVTAGALNAASRARLVSWCVWVAVSIFGLSGCDGSRRSADRGSLSNETTTRANPSVAFAQPSPSPQAQPSPQDGRDAESLAEVRKLLLAAPQDRETLIKAIELESRRGDHRSAAELTMKVADGDPKNSAALLIRAFDHWLRCGDFEAAENTLLRLVKMRPQHIEGHRLLAQVYNAQGRRREASKHVTELIRLRAIGPEETLSLIDRQGPFLLASFNEFAGTNDETMFSLGQIRIRYLKQNAAADEVLGRLIRLRERFPASTAVAAFQGRVIAETGRQDDLNRWMQSLPQGMDVEPEYWSAIGKGLVQQNRHDEAIRAFGEALRRDPTDRGSLRAIVQSLDKKGLDQQAGPIREKLAILDKIFRIAKEADSEQAVWIAEQMQILVRPWESAAWLIQASRLTGDLQRVLPELNRRHASIVAWESRADTTEEKINRARVANLLSLDINGWPMPKLDENPITATPNRMIETDRVSRFRDVAADHGLDASFQSGYPDNGRGFYLQQINGGGLAAVDYDLDGRCDIYLVQSGGSPNDRAGSTANQLFRRTPEGHFNEVTGPSGAGDRSFGQGVCAGDVNQDGFLDLLVANIGANTILVNQGDGTFREQWVANISDVENWTSCLALGDLSGDHLPELVEINYVDDPAAYTVRCEDDYLACQPQVYQAASDRILQISPGGEFHQWPAAESMVDHPKFGFGVVIANFDRKDGNDVFVANDGDLNQYWTSIQNASGLLDRFGIIESAIVRGCSIGRGGNSQACMGVASGDFNRDGTLDLHVTNFSRESVNLFLQSKSGYFSDECLAYGLVEPSYEMLGFGTQAADFDNDGWLDLAVLNGHVFNADDDSTAFKMQPQVMQGFRGGFTALDARKIGTYWEGHRLGRTLAMADWNRDGKMDLLANHLDAPVALLQNESPSQAWVQFELIGTQSERDAIGAEVQVRCGQELWTAWQTGGDGLMSTNEPVLHFGLGNQPKIDQIIVRWPSGVRQTFDNLESDLRYLIVEGMQEIHVRKD